MIFSDIFGIKLVNNKLIADAFGRAGYYTLIPDLFDGNAIEDFSKWEQWRASLDMGKVVSTVAQVAEGLDTLDHEFVGVVGHCFGAKFAIQQLSEKGKASVAAVAHPSMVEIDEVAQIKRPILISCAENDPVFTDDLRHKTEDKLKEIGARYQFDKFSGTDHGFACRGDTSIETVKYAQEKALLDMIYWFDYFSK